MSASAVQALSDAILPWIIRLAGLFWLIGAFALFRQIRMEMALDRMTATIDAYARDLETQIAEAGEQAPEPNTDGYRDIDAPPKRRVRSEAEQAVDAWIDRDDAARRGWIAGQSVVLAATALAMLFLHPLASWLVALLVLGQGVYFFWREYVTRRAPTPGAADHARPTRATVNAAWVSLVVAMLVWTAAFRGLLN